MPSSIANPPATVPTYPMRPTAGGARPRSLPGQWTYEPKYNGWRALVHVPSRSVFNRHGTRLTIAAEFAAALQDLESRWTGSVLAERGCEWVDCEGLERRHTIGRGTLFVFDAILPAVPFLERRDLVLHTFCYRSGHGLRHDCKPCDHFVHVPPAWHWGTALAPLQSLCDPPSVSDVERLWQELQDLNKKWGAEFYEGLVAKRLDSTYNIQLISPDQHTAQWIKFRWDW